MAKIDKNGAVHGSDGKYTGHIGTPAAFDLAPAEPAANTCECGASFASFDDLNEHQWSQRHGEFNDEGDAYGEDDVPPYVAQVGKYAPDEDDEPEVVPADVQPGDILRLDSGEEVQVASVRELPNPDGYKSLSGGHEILFVGEEVPVVFEHETYFAERIGHESLGDDGLAEGRAEALCNLWGEDPNDEEAWQNALAHARQEIAEGTWPEKEQTVEEAARERAKIAGDDWSNPMVREHHMNKTVLDRGQSVVMTADGLDKAAERSGRLAERARKAWEGVDVNDGSAPETNPRWAAALRADAEYNEAAHEAQAIRERLAGTSHPGAGFSAPLRTHTREDMGDFRGWKAATMFSDDRGHTYTAFAIREGLAGDGPFAPVYSTRDGRDLTFGMSSLGGETHVSTFSPERGHEPVGTMTVELNARGASLYGYRTAGGQVQSPMYSTREAAVEALARSTRPVAADRDVEGEYTAEDARAAALSLVDRDRRSNSDILSNDSYMAMVAFGEGKPVRADQLHAALSQVFDRLAWTRDDEDGPFNQAGRLATYIDNHDN